MEWFWLLMTGSGAAIAPGAIAGGVIGGIVGNRSDAGMMKAWDATAGLLRRGDREMNFKSTVQITRTVYLYYTKIVV